MLVKLVGKTLTSRLGFAALGAGAMYFADPDRGRTRRARLVAQSESRVRRGVRQATRRTEAQERHLMGRLEGVMAKARGGGKFHPESDVDLREHLRQVIHTIVPARQVNVDVGDGDVTLRGQVDDEEMRTRILESVRAVAGVRGVKDFTHLPGQAPPNKLPADS